MIGKFGVGLKDALATFDRHNIKVLIKSKFGDISIGRANKHGFDDISTLHALIHESSDSEMVGTDFILDGIEQSDIAQAKDLFLKYSGDTILAETKYGMILNNIKNRKARVYINGLSVAEEENFLFSYNITSLTATLRKALNRERSYVGRSAYTERIKNLLLATENSVIANKLADDLHNIEKGKAHDELQWINVQLHACGILNLNKDVIFLTSSQLISGNSLILNAQQAGHRIVVVPDSVYHKLSGQEDASGSKIRNLEQYKVEYNNNFQFEFISPQHLTSQEQGVFSMTEEILELANYKNTIVNKILISETMKINESSTETLGIWDSENKNIIIKRSQLQNLESYAGVLLHELTHAITGADDFSLEFQNGLTRLLGTVTNSSLKDKKSHGFISKIFQRK